MTGPQVIRQGDEGRELYIVARGSFGIFACSPDGLQETRVGTLRPGDCFGEMALLTGEVRSATVRADAEGELLELDRARFVELIRREPEMGLVKAHVPDREQRCASARELRRAPEAAGALTRDP